MVWELGTKEMEHLHHIAKCWYSDRQQVLKTGLGEKSTDLHNGSSIITTRNCVICRLQISMTCLSTKNMWNDLGWFGPDEMKLVKSLVRKSKTCSHIYSPTLYRRNTLHEIKFTHILQVFFTENWYLTDCYCNSVKCFEPPSLFFS